MKVKNKTICENCPARTTCRKNRAKINLCKRIKKYRERGS